MSNYNERILIVEDDAQIRRYIKYILEKEGYRCFQSMTGQDALNKIVMEQIELVILDLGLPDMDGIDVIKHVREWSEIPIIVVSARDQDKEKVTALNEGADDYLTKPFSASELIARCGVAVRHLYRMGNRTVQSVFEVGELKIDYEKHSVYIKNDMIHLSPMEYNLLVMMSKNAGKVITTGSILKELWGTNYGTDTQALRTLMAGLRRKIEEVPAEPRYLFTEIGVGYRLVEE